MKDIVVTAWNISCMSTGGNHEIQNKVYNKQILFDYTVGKNQTKSKKIICSSSKLNSWDQRNNLT